MKNKSEDIDVARVRRVVTKRINNLSLRSVAEIVGLPELITDFDEHVIDIFELIDILEAVLSDKPDEFFIKIYEKQLEAEESVQLFT